MTTVGVRFVSFEEVTWTLRLEKGVHEVPDKETLHTASVRAEQTRALAKTAVIRMSLALNTRASRARNTLHPTRQRPGRAVEA